MKTYSIRMRVTGALLLLIAMAVMEAAIVLLAYREIESALAEQERTTAILLQQEQAGRTLAATQASYRGSLLSAAGVERGAFDNLSAVFDREMAALRPLVRDPMQRQRLEEVVRLVAAWRALAQPLLGAAARGEAVAAHLSGEATLAFRAIESELQTFRSRQVAINETAVAAFRAQLATAMMILTAVPLGAIFVLAGILIVTDRQILVPLATLAQAARRLADGDYTTALPPHGADEVGALVGAFKDMRNAVQERAAAADEANTRLKASHRELLATVDLVPSAIMILGADGAIRLQNRAASSILGEPPAGDDERRAFWQRFQIRDAVGRPVRLRDSAPVRALAGIETIAEELDLQRPDGRRVVILLGALPLRDDRDGIIGAVVGFQDITRLRELDQMKDEFVSIVSHELRTPLAAIRGSLQLVIEDRGAGVDEHGQLLAVALKSCDRLVRIINDMLDLSKIEAGKVELRLAALPATAPIQLAIDGVQGVAAAAGVTIACDAAAGLPAVWGDADRLTQVLVNLLSNAVKFSPRGSTVTVVARELDGMMQFTVADQGPGIADADIGRLFKKFQQLDAAATRRTGGTGLGLVITKGIINEHGGDIWVESEVGRGTQFHFTIPLAMSSDADDDVDAGTASADDAGAPPRILVAEDNDELRLVWREALERRGYRVIEAADGREAILAARRERPHLVLLDLKMPGVGGHDVIRFLRKYKSTLRVPIIVVSGSVSERQSLESLVLGANIFIAKPADARELVNDVDRLLQRERRDATPAG